MSDRNKNKLNGKPRHPYTSVVSSGRGYKQHIARMKYNVTRIYYSMKSSNLVVVVAYWISIANR